MPIRSVFRPPCYPNKDIDGNIISVCGRTLDPDYKEKKIRKYTYFQSIGYLGTIYGLYDNMSAIREQGEVILFEGAKSVMMADGWGRTEYRSAPNKPPKREPIPGFAQTWRQGVIRVRCRN